MKPLHLLQVTFPILLAVAIDKGFLREYEILQIKMLSDFNYKEKQIVYFA